jgi:signal peptidase I
VGCLLELLETFLFTLVVFLIIQVFLAEPYRVQQDSMENTLMPDQYVLVDKVTPHFDDYHRGDIVVFNPPPGWVQDSAGSESVKRIIGIGGDTIDIHGGHVFLNGVQLTEGYIREDQPTVTPTKGAQTWKLGPNQVFVLGDHRLDSRDSREFGPIDKSSIVGRAFVRYWPLSDFGLVSQQKQPAASGSPVRTASPAPSKP